MKVKTSNTVISENCILEIISTLGENEKNFTTALLSERMDNVYGVKLHPSLMNRFLGELMEASLIKKLDLKDGKNYIFQSIDDEGIINLKDETVQLPQRIHVRPKSIVYDSIDPVKVLGQKNYDEVIFKLQSQLVETGGVMVLTIAAIMNHCWANETNTFTSRTIARKLPMVKGHTILAKIQKLQSKRCCISAELSTDEEGSVWYTLKHDCLNYNTFSKEGVMVERPESYVEVEHDSVDDIEEVEKPMTTDVEYSSHQVGEGVIAVILKEREINSNLKLQLEALVKENAELLLQKSQLEEEVGIYKELCEDAETKLHAVTTSKTSSSSGITMSSDGEIKVKSV